MTRNLICLTLLAAGVSAGPAAAADVYRTNLGEIREMIFQGHDLTDFSQLPPSEAGKPYNLLEAVFVEPRPGPAGFLKLAPKETVIGRI